MYNTIPGFKFPQGQELTTFLKDILEEEVDEKYNLTEKNLKHLQREFGSKGKDITGKDIIGTLTASMGTGGGNVPYLQQLNNPKHSINRVYGSNGISPTLNTMQGGNRQPKVLHIKNATKKGYIEAKEGDGIILDNPNSKTKRGRVKSGISGTLTCAGSDGVVTKNLGIRKLTPIECERLQGFPDGWSSNIVSKSQTYKQMGNSVSVPVVKKLFDNLL